MATGRRLRIGVIGLGEFAQDVILPAIDQLEDVELTALVSGTPEKLEVLGRRHHVAALADYAGVDALLASDVVDAVHLVLPPSLHAHYAIRCAQRGIHVLCEKPMAPSEAECRAMIDAADAGGIKLMVGYRLHFESAGSGAAARSRALTATFAHRVPEVAAWDLGIYCIDAARALFHAEPCEVMAMPGRLTEPYFDDIDERTFVVLRFPDGRSATFVTRYGEHRARCEVTCSGGAVETSAMPPAPRARLTPRERIADEIRYFARCIRDDIAPEPSGLAGLADVRILLALDRSAEHGCAELLGPLPRTRRPRMAQVFTAVTMGG